MHTEQNGAQSSVQLCVSYVQCAHINTRAFHSLGNVIRVGRGRLVFETLFAISHTSVISVAMITVHIFNVRSVFVSQFYHFIDFIMCSFQNLPYRISP